jgi:hypothetical protein
MQIVWGFYLGRSAQLSSISPLPVITDKAKKLFSYGYQFFRIVLVIALLMFGLSFYYLKQAEQEKDPILKLDYYWRSGMLFPALEFYHSMNAQRTIVHLQDSSFDTNIRGFLSQHALEDIDTAINRASIRANNYIIKANILRTQDVENYLEINRLYEKSITLDPYQVHIRNEYTDYLVSQGHQEKALHVFWEGWNRLYSDFYANGITFLKAQLALNEQYGAEKESAIIKKEIKRLKDLKVKNQGGDYIFHR